MKKDERYTLEILNRIEENSRITQPEIAGHLGISLGLTNAFIKRIARKGYIKLTTIPRDRAKYLLTPQGIAEKSRLTLTYLQYSVNFYKQAKETISRAYAQLEQEGVKNIVFYGIGEIAEIAYILLQQKQMKLAGVIDETKAGTVFLKHTVGVLADLKNLHFDKIIITGFDSAEEINSRLRQLFIPANKILVLMEVTMPKSTEASSRGAAHTLKKEPA
jgi:DNA-binding MarR family transcriptional regulator